MSEKPATETSLISQSDDTQQPPAYSATSTVPDDSAATGNVEEPPPSYDSLFGEVRAAKESSTSPLDFFKKFLAIVLGTIGCTICVGIILAIPISMIVIGAMFLHDCAVQHYIPIYLIVFGCFGLVRNVSSFAQRIRDRRRNREREESVRTNPFDGLIGCFLIVWFIVGNVWIYGSYSSVQFDEIDAATYCNPVLYWFAFWMTTSTYIIIGASCVLCLSICCCGMVAGLCAATSASSASSGQ